MNKNLLDCEQKSYVKNVLSLTGISNNGGTMLQFASLVDN